MESYPEHAKMQEVKHQAQAIGEFLEWLSEIGYMIAQYNRFDELYPALKSHGELLADYFSIDLAVVATEKQALFEALRAHTPRWEPQNADPRRVKEMRDADTQEASREAAGATRTPRVNSLIQHRRMLLAEVDRLTEHSQMLNTIGWRIATALGDVPEGAEEIEGKSVDQADRLIAEVVRLREIVDALRES